jgi:nitrogen fixation NifU-like protein
MNDDIYHIDLMRLAAEAHGAGRLDTPDATVTLSNPLCGDRITMDVTLHDGKISAISHDVRACVLCQAAASLIGRRAIGQSPEALRRITEQVELLLKGTAKIEGDWPEIAVFAPVAGRKSRHVCVLLPFRALTQATEAAGTKA